MRNKISLLLKMALVSIICIAALTACGKKNEEAAATPTPEAAVTTAPTAAAPTEAAPANVPEYCKGYYEAQIAGGQYSSKLVLKPDGTFYISLLNDKDATAGTYEYVEQEMEFTITVNEKEETKKAPAFFRLTHYNGTVDESPFMDNTVYQVTQKGFKSNMAHVDGEFTLAEKPVKVVEYALAEDEYCTILLQHNGTYIDTINEYMEGSWTKDGGTFTLQPADVTGTCSLAVAEDGKSAEYKDLEGKAYALILPNQPIVSFKGEKLEIAIMKEGKAQLLYVGAAAKEGTWTFADGKFTLQIDGADVPVTVAADGTQSAEYTLESATLTETMTLKKADIDAATEKLTAKAE